MSSHVGWCDNVRGASPAGLAPLLRPVADGLHDADGRRGYYV